MKASKVRRSFSLSQAIKDMLPLRENREALCEELAPHYLDAVKRWPDDPLQVVSFEIPGGERLCLAEHPVKKGKVKVWIDESDTIE